jgi:hypothetical protein
MASRKRKSKRNKQPRTGNRRRIAQFEPLEERRVLTCLFPDVPINISDTLDPQEVEFYNITLCSGLDLDDGDTLIIETLGSTLTPSNDTELGLYNDVGDVLALNDDIDAGAGNLLSRLNLPADLTTGQTTLQTLASGDYTIAAGAFDTTFNSGLDGMGNPNATSTSNNTGNLEVSVTVSQNNFGTLVSGTTATDTDPLVAEEVKFFRFELAESVTTGNGNSLVIDTLGSSLTDAGFGPNDTEIGLFDAIGNLIATNDDAGVGTLTSQLSFGDGGVDGDQNQIQTNFG